MRYIYVLPLIAFCWACNNPNQDQVPDAPIKQPIDGNQTFDRHVELDGQVNFRDLGMYSTVGGKVIKPGMVYRSGLLAKLSDEDVKELEDLGIKTVVTFLTPNEIANAGEDRLPEGARNVYLAIEGNGDEIDDLIKARKTGNFESLPTDFNFNIHSELTETGKEQYAALLHLMADSSNYPIVFHCSHGVHRTGNAAATLLSLVGVPWETVSEDYMLSDEYRKEESLARIDYLDSIARVMNTDLDYEENRRSIEAFYTLQPEYLEGAKAHILEEYGSFENYAKSAGLTEKELKRIRKLMLRKAAR